MRLPNVLIVGAMKSGTTGVFFDLCRHPHVFEPDNKEPHCLCDDRVLTGEGRGEYAAVYAGAAPDQMLCDGSTGYTKLPDHQGVVERALAVLPDDFRVIYVVRDPIDRIASHHHHEFVEGKMPASIDEAVREFPRLVNYSRYGYQLSPWVDAIGIDRVRVVRFEDYRADRHGTTASLCEWLGLDSGLLPSEDVTIHNQAAGKPLITKKWRGVQTSWWYQHVLRRMLPPRTRNWLQRVVLPKVQERPAPPTHETVEWLRSELTKDVQHISEYATEAEALWQGYSAAGRPPHKTNSLHVEPAN